MSESPWSEEGASAPKKKRIPTWAWWVGGGCLFIVLALAVAGYLAVSFVKSSLDPEKQWPKVEQVLHYDKRPENLQLFWGSQVGMDIFFFREQHGLIVVLMRLSAGEGEKSRRKIFDEKENFSAFGTGGRHSMKPGKLVVQGRELQVLRFVQTGGQSGGSAGSPSAGAGGSMMVDLTPEDSEEPVILQVTRSDGSDEPIADETVIELLEPFHVGPKR